MSFDYSNIEKTSIAQVNDKGRPVSVLYKTEGSYDPTTDDINGGGNTTVEVKAIITNFNKRDAVGGLVEAGDLQVMIAASGISKPKTNDIIIDGDEQFTIVNVNEIKPGSVALLYKLQVRKG